MNRQPSPREAFGARRRRRSRRSRADSRSRSMNTTTSRGEHDPADAPRLAHAPQALRGHGQRTPRWSLADDQQHAAPVPPAEADGGEGHVAEGLNSRSAPRPSARWTPRYARTGSAMPPITKSATTNDRIQPAAALDVVADLLLGGDVARLARPASPADHCWKSRSSCRLMKGPPRAAEQARQGGAGAGQPHRHIVFADADDLRHFGVAEAFQGEHHDLAQAERQRLHGRAQPFVALFCADGVFGIGLRRRPPARRRRTCRCAAAASDRLAYARLWAMRNTNVRREQSPRNLGAPARAQARCPGRDPVPRRVALVARREPPNACSCSSRSARSDHRELSAAIRHRSRAASPQHRFRDGPRFAAQPATAASRR